LQHLLTFFVFSFQNSSSFLFYFLGSALFKFTSFVSAGFLIFPIVRVNFPYIFRESKQVGLLSVDLLYNKEMSPLLWIL
jgi:hypothetical protein